MKKGICMQSAKVLLAASLFFVVAYGQESKSTRFPVTPSGKQVEEYIKAFNSGEEEMREYFLNHAAKENLRKLPVDQKLQRYRQMHERLGALELRKINESGNDTFSGLFHGSKGNLVNLEFEFEKSAPYGLLGVRVEDAGRDREGVPADHKKNNDDLVRAVEQYTKGLANNDRFSGVIFIAQHGKPVFERAYGYADREKKIPNRIDTRFNLGSVNKSFTHLAIDQLVAKGKISLNDPIKKYLPDYPNKEAAEKVTVQQLLEMRSGIGDFFGDRYEAFPKERLRSLQAYLPLFTDKPLEFEPGTRERYSNGGFVVLGLIVEKASGMDYYSYVRKNIFLPAGMTHTDSFEKDSLPSDCAIGYTSEGSVWKSNHETLPEKGSSAGGGYSTVHDLFNYTIALEKGTITGPGVEERRGMGIAGGAPGLNTALEWGQKTGYVIVVMSNFDPPSAERVAQQIRAWLPTN